MIDLLRKWKRESESFEINRYLYPVKGNLMQRGRLYWKQRSAIDLQTLVGADPTAYVGLITCSTLSPDTP
jgi:hypothetical protein